MRRPFVVAALVVCGVALASEDELVERGEYLLAAGGCIDCHTEDRRGAVPLAGGRELETPFGTFYSPNITPDVTTGIGGWSDDDFVKAFWEGVNPDGEHYYPAFPYTAYTGVSREDLLAMKAYLFSLDPVSATEPEHDLAWYVSTRLAAGAWKLQNFSAGRFVPDPERDEQWNRGAYLVRHLGHCGECHTPRNRFGAPDRSRELAGYAASDDGDAMPNITPHRGDGIGRWTLDDIEYFLDAGMLPDGDYVGGSMSAVIDTNTSKLTKTDRLAIAAYLRSVPALPTEN